MKQLPRTPIRAIFAACSVALVCVFASYFIRHWSEPPPVEPLFSGLGSYSRKISTTSVAAQRYFDQGLAFFYAYNVEAAIRSFQAAADSDPSCAMANWGIAMACGGSDINPLNNDFRADAGWIASRKALKLLGNATPVEAALVSAVSRRFDNPPAADRRGLDHVFADAMRLVWKSYPEDPDVGALTAKAIMIPRVQEWTPDGAPTPETAEATRIVEAVLRKFPRHPFALHLYIHLVEGTSHPQRAAAVADLLRDMAPGLGHLLHMPTHIDIQLGHWQAAVIASDKAIASDEAYQRIVTDPGLYRGFMLHNYHMLAYAAAMQGESRKATESVREMIAELPANYATAPLEDFYYAMPGELHVRFGRWDEMLAEPPPAGPFPFADALWHWGRGVAFAAKREVGPAKAEMAEFVAAGMHVSPQLTIGANAATFLLFIAGRMLAGEIAYREGFVNGAIAELTEAVQSEDKLNYSEPPPLLLPARHVLGATLMDARRYAEAEAVYREDLVRHPENGWSLFGLSQSLRKQKKTAEAEAVAARFKQAWQYADMKLTASCLCLPAKE